MATTQPGGLYKVGDQLVDSEGKPTQRVKAEKDAAEPKGTASTPKSGPVGDLAPDFPSREALAAAGLTTRAAVGAKTDAELDAIPSIGPAGVTAIRDALK